MSDAVPLLDELRVLAQNGLRYADDPYDRERYERILELVSGEYAGATGLDPADVSDRFADRLGHVTPNVGARGAVVRGGELLVMCRAGDGTWSLPGGFTEPGETPAETAEREVREETGLRVDAHTLVDWYWRDPDEHNPHGFVVAVFRCEVVGGELEGSHEDRGLDFRHPDDVPEWHKDHERSARDALAAAGADA
jgi:ADP-ribose pyrophosphatase YjhB (NUDIX family)